METILKFSSCEDPWYVVQCKPRMEYFAASALRNLIGLSVFVPEYEVSLRNKAKKLFPFFPGYFFVQVDLQKVALSSINTSPGVVHLISFDGKPEPLPSSIVLSIYERLQRISTLNHFPSPFRVGDPIRVKDGPLKELEMIFLGPTTPDGRVRVLLTMLGRQKEIQIEATALEKVPDMRSFYLERSSRGKGRKIHRSV